MFRIHTIKILFCISIILMSVVSCKQNTTGGKDVPGSADSSAVTSSDTAVSINFSSPVADEKILLKFNPPVGNTYFITNNTTYTAFQSQDTIEMKANSTKYAKIKLRILSKDAGFFKLEFTVTDARKTVKDDSSLIEYQYGKALTDPKADLDRKIEDCMVNSPLVITINGKGEGTDVQGYDDILSKIKAIIKKEMGTDVPDEYIASQVGTPTDNLENFFISYPDTAVKIGDTWEFSTPSVLQGVPIILTNHYILADRREGLAYVNFTTDIVIDKSQMPKEALDQMQNLKFSAYIKGTGEIDEKTGWPMTMKISQGMELSDEVQGIKAKTKQTSNGVLRSVLQ